MQEGDKVFCYISQVSRLFSLGLVRGEEHGVLGIKVWPGFGKLIDSILSDGPFVLISHHVPAIADEQCGLRVEFDYVGTTFLTLYDKAHKVHQLEFDTFQS